MTTLVGGLSLARLDERFATLGWVGQARFWLFLALLVAYVACRVVEYPEVSRLPLRAAKAWAAAVIVLHAYLVLSVAWAPDPAEASRAIPDLLLLMGLLGMAPRIFARHPERSIEILLHLFYWASLVVLLGAIPSYWAGLGELGALGAGAIGFARTAGTGVIAALYLWAKTGRATWLMPIGPLLLGTAVSGSRNVAAAVTLSAGLYTWLVLRRLPRRRFLSGALVGLALVWTALSFVPLAKERVAIAWASLWEAGTAALTAETLYWAERDVLFGLGWRLFREAPTIGVGLGGYEQLTGRAYPHNLTLNIAAEGGAVGLALFVVPLAVLAVRWRRARSLEHTTAFSVGTLYFVASMFAGTYYDARFMWLLFFLYMLPSSTASMPPDALGPECCCRSIRGGHG